MKQSEKLVREVLQRTNLFAITGAPLFSTLLVALAGTGLYRPSDGGSAVVIVSYSVVAIWGILCFRGAVRTCLNEGYWLAASALPFAVVSYFIGPLTDNVCIILATILAVGTAIEFVVRDDADLHKLVKDFRTSRISSS